MTHKLNTFLALPKKVNQKG